MTTSTGNVDQAFMAVLEWREAQGNAPVSSTLLSRLCGGDSFVQSEVKSLLSHLETAGEEHNGSPRFLNPNELHGSRAPSISRDAALEEWGGEAVGQRIGDYVIIGQIGSGGMGIVYVAEQQRPHRTVALKVIRRTIATATVIARFEREAELLGRLSHSGIAQIYAAGIADVSTVTSGMIRVPYIAMELVRGLPIVEHIRTFECKTEEVLQLILQACDAIQHAHHRGVIHRDIKPANLLVAVGDAQPQVKVLDFGVARAVEANFADAAIVPLTAHGLLIGTPAYMSPEQIQARSEGIDTRCDVYALGAMLFHLLTNKHAIDLTGCSLAEAAKRIVEHPPARLGSVDRRFRGDIETIVAKAIEKDPARRYQSPAELGRDLSHFLRREPIEAKRDSLAYVLGKRATRYRNLLATMCLLMVSLTLFGTYARSQARRQQEIAQTALLAQQRADQTVNDVSLQLSDSQVEQARLLALEGDQPAAETILWREYTRRPGSARVRSALWELYSHPGNQRASSDQKPESRARVMSPGGLLYAFATEAGNLRLSSPGTGRPTIELATKIGNIRSLNFSADGARLLASGTGGMTLYNAATGKELRKFAGFPGAINSSQLSDDGKLIISAGEDGAVRLWDTSSDTPLATLTTTHGPGRAVGFNRATTQVAATFEDGIVMLLSFESSPSMANLQETTKFPSHSGAPGVTIGFSPDGKILASGAEDRVVRLWKIADGSPVDVLHPGDIAFDGGAPGTGAATPGR